LGAIYFNRSTELENPAFSDFAWANLEGAGQSLELSLHWWYNEPGQVNRRASEEAELSNTVRGLALTLASGTCNQKAIAIEERLSNGY
jgi:hypothetical protein